MRPGCFEILGFRAAVLQVRIHLPPAVSHANFRIRTNGTGDGDHLGIEVARGAAGSISHCRWEELAGPGRDFFEVFANAPI